MEFLESSALSARLQHRLSSSSGVIDVQDILKTYARLTKWASRARLLIDDLLAKYTIDDGSAPGNLPLVTEQPWMLNLNTYLTNRNSFSSTANNSYSANTNQFFSQTLSSSPAASPLVTSDLTSFSPPTGPALGHISRHERSHDVKAAQLESESSSQASGKFRVSRKPRRVPTEIAGKIPAPVARDVQKNPIAQPLPALTYHSGSSRQPGKQEGDETARTKDIETAPSKITESTIVSAANLPLVARPPAQLPAQRELTGAAGKTSPLVAKDRPSSDRSQSIPQEQPALRRSAADRALGSAANLPLGHRPPAQLPAQRELTGATGSTSPLVSKDRPSSYRPQSIHQEQPALQRSAADHAHASAASLPLVARQLPDPRERTGEAGNTSPLDSKDWRDSAQVLTPLNRSTELTKLTLNQNLQVARPADGSRLAMLETQVASEDSQNQQADFFARRDAERTVEALNRILRTPGTEGGTPFLPKPRQPDLVWRRNGIDRTVRELMSAISDRTSFQTTQRTSAGISTQSPQSIQSFERESVSRKTQTPDGVEITAERILRRISRTLLVERDRRGY